MRERRRDRERKQKKKEESEGVRSREREMDGVFVWVEGVAETEGGAAPELHWFELSFCTGGVIV